MGKIRNNRLDALNQPCTITEAVQIATAVSDDAIQEYQRHSAPLQAAMSLQIDMLKEIVISHGLITEDDFKEKYILRANEFNNLQREKLEEANSNSPKTAYNVDEVSVKVVK